jgi:hypothetical protein
MSARPTPTSELADVFPGLEMLARSYVDLSWDYEYGSPEAAVVAFVEDNPGLAASAAGGLRHLLTACLDDASRLAQLRPLGWGYTGGSRSLALFLTWAADALEVAARTVGEDAAHADRGPEQVPR